MQQLDRTPLERAGDAGVEGYFLFDFVGIYDFDFELVPLKRICDPSLDRGCPAMFTIFVANDGLICEASNYGITIIGVHRPHQSGDE